MVLLAAARSVTSRFSCSVLAGKLESPLVRFTERDGLSPSQVCYRRRAESPSLSPAFSSFWNSSNRRTLVHMVGQMVVGGFYIVLELGLEGFSRRYERFKAAAFLILPVCVAHAWTLLLGRSIEGALNLAG